jgi:cytoskeletal protein CcmA (bactofilin family)
MAWKWPGSAKNGVSEEWTGFIDQGVTLEGTLQITGTFRIDGNVKGNIISEQTVVLGDRAKVEGQIEGNRVVISGRFDGVIFAKGRVEIQAKGVVTGEVHARLLRRRIGSHHSHPRRRASLNKTSLLRTVNFPKSVGARSCLRLLTIYLY